MASVTTAVSPSSPHSRHVLCRVTLCSNTSSPLRWGRVPSQSLGYGICAVCVLLLGVKMPVGFRNMLGILSRCAVMGASCATWVATPELFKTDLRATGHSVASSVARIGAFSAPFLVDSDASGFTVGVCLAIASAFATVAALFLPETMGKCLYLCVLCLCS